ncbi:MAG: hypothetical protein AB1439_05140 [candidate division FCPU426 bacterium]
MNAMRTLCLLGLLLPFLAGCASVNVQPFQTFQSAVKQGQAAMDDSLGLGVDWVRSADAQTFDGQMSQLVMRLGQGYDWTLEPVPLYLRIKQARKVFWILNDNMQSYAGLLLRLADNQVDDPAAFETLAAQLNRNAETAAQALNWAPPKEGIPVFSAVAVEAAREYIRGKRLEALGRIVRENQPLVEKYAAHCTRLIQLLRENFKAYYGDHYEPIRAAWKQSPAGSRAALVEQMYALNDRLIDILDALQQMEKIYAALPAAHQELAQAVKATALTFDRPGLQLLIEEGRQLGHLYENLKSDK